MKQKEWFWCGAVLFALSMFISLHSIQEPLYTGIAGVLCALVSTILLGCGFRTNAREKSAAESKRMEEEQKQLEAQHQTQKECIDALLGYLRERFDAQQKSYTVALNQLQTDITAVTGEIHALGKTIISESQSHSKVSVQLTKDVRESSETVQTQIKDGAKDICDLLLEQHTALRNVLERQGNESAIYHKFMLDQPVAEIKTLSETLQSIVGQVDSILSAVDFFQSDTEKQIKKALDRLNEDSKSLQEKLQYVCETLETQGKESRDAMERVMQGYSDVTSQDIEVLSALVKDARV